jgi:hypothetical protein
MAHRGYKITIGYSIARNRGEGSYWYDVAYIEIGTNSDKRIERAKRKLRKWWDGYLIREAKAEETAV